MWTVVRTVSEPGDARERLNEGPGRAADDSASCVVVRANSDHVGRAGHEAVLQPDAAPNRRALVSKAVHRRDWVSEECVGKRKVESIMAADIKLAEGRER